MYFLWKISGGDVTIIRKCSAATKAVFSRLGAFVLAFHIIVFFGFLFAMLYVLDIIHAVDGQGKMLPDYAVANHDEVSLGQVCAAVSIAAFLTFVFGNIYLLTITTYSKNVLPIKPHLKSNYLSAILRIGFLVFFAVLISKPIEVMLIQGQEELEADVAAHQEELLAAFAVPERNEGEGSTAHTLHKIEHSIRSANYFLYKIQLISSSPKYAWTWLLSLLFIGLFIVPVLIKQSLKLEGEYYLKLKEVQVDLIQRAYADFQIQYEQLSLVHMRTPCRFYEAYEDAPFNTRKKGDKRIYKKQQDFFDLFNPHDEA